MAHAIGRIMKLLERADYRPVTLKKLARRLGVESEDDYAALRAELKGLVEEGRVEVGRDKTIRLIGVEAGVVIGVFRRAARGHGFVRPRQATGRGSDIFIPAGKAADASTGDEVAVKVKSRVRGLEQGPEGKIVRVLSRARGQFVGSYFEDGGEGFVQADGTIFRDPIHVGDPGAKRARAGDKVAFEMLRYPTADRAGEGVITEVLGPRGQPGVDTLMVLRSFDIPDEFDGECLEEARLLADEFDPEQVGTRMDLRDVWTITIDPATARDFDDAITLARDERGFWNLGVHIADVGHFVRSGSLLDRAARQRGTSVYLPDLVVPMLPEVLSNGLASLQEGQTRFTMSVLLQFDEEGRRTHREFARSVIRVDRRFTYEQAYELMMNPENAAPGVPGEVRVLLRDALTLAMTLRRRRMERGSLELVMPEVEVDLDAEGRVVGAHLAPDDESHQVIEEFMLAANEAVAEFLTERGVVFLRRAHADPDAHKLAQFAEFVRSLGFEMELERSRFELQRALAWSDARPERHAVHYALLRSLKQANYTIEPEGHFALASTNYCHFTSPIRRYPDLQVHRQLAAVLAGKHPRSRVEELADLAEHCTRTERRAEAAERDLIRIKLLSHLESRIGEAFHAVIIGVEDFGLFCQIVELPVEGLLHVTSLAGDYYYLEAETHTLVARRSGRRFRLGDRIEVRVARVNVDRRELDLVPAESPWDEAHARALEHRRPRGGRGRSRPAAGFTGQSSSAPARRPQAKKRKR